MAASVKRLVPVPVRRAVMKIHPRYRRFCPICRMPVAEFLPTYQTGRPHAVCPSCGARERHRMTWQFLAERSDLFDGRPKRMLHVAAQRGIARRLAGVPNLEYITADLENPAAMVKMDITEIGYPEETFDVILCSHVLEHVPDDRRAMRELYRVLKTGGWAVLLVPITADETFEDPSIKDPRLRERLFGQSDHVRQYGPDFADRLAEAGFQVRVFQPRDIVPAQDADRLSVPADEYPLYFCRKG